MTGWLRQVHTPSGCLHTNARERKDNILESNIQVVFKCFQQTGCFSNWGTHLGLPIEKDRFWMILDDSSHLGFIPMTGVDFLLKRTMPEF